MVFKKCCITTRTKVISIHALREEGDFTPTGGAIRMMIFLSTPSARRATVASNVSLTHTVVFLSTPSARRATTPTLL